MRQVKLVLPIVWLMLAAGDSSVRADDPSAADGVVSWCRRQAGRGAVNVVKDGR